MIDIYVIGCGGIGGYLLNLLPQTMACLAVDYSIEVMRISNDQIMGSNGTSNMLVNPFRSITLVDGDTFDGHNSLRQAGAAGSKIQVQMHKIRQMDAFTTWLNTTQLRGFNNYLTPANIRQIIPAPKKINYSTEDMVRSPATGYYDNRSKFSIKNIPVIFPCVDNHKTRYEITKWAETFDNVLIFNGGNEKTKGNVLVYEKYDGINFDPPIYKIYPEVNDKTDLRPDETSCTDVASKNDQTAITNNVIASFMLAMFTKWFRTGGFKQKTRERDENGNFKEVRRNEVLIDLEKMTTTTLTHLK